MQFSLLAGLLLSSSYLTVCSLYATPGAKAARLPSSNLLKQVKKFLSACSNPIYRA
jgi:hypothetical protein